MKSNLEELKPGRERQSAAGESAALPGVELPSWSAGRLKDHIFQHPHHAEIHRRLTTRLWVTTLACWLFAGASSAVEWVAGRIDIDFAIGLDRWLGPALVVWAVMTVWNRLGGARE